MYIRTGALSEDSCQPAYSGSLIQFLTWGVLDSPGRKVSTCGQQNRWFCADTHADLSRRGGAYVRRYVFHFITKTSLFKYTENFTTKNENFQIKNSDMFLVSAQNIDCGYSLEPPRRGGSNEYPQSMFWADIRNTMYTPVNPSFYYIKVGFKGVKII